MLSEVVSTATKLDGKSAEEAKTEQVEKEILLKIKILVMILVLISGCFVFFPYSKFVNNKKDGCCKGVFLKLMTCFAAGMLMALSIVHILPEAAGIYKAF